MADETEPAAPETPSSDAAPAADPASPADAAPAADAAADQPPPGHVIDAVTGLPRPMTFMERARVVAGQAASTAAKVTVDVGTQAAKASVDLGGKAARAAGDAGGKAAATIRDPATKARAQSALKKAKRGFTTVLERIDPRILADVVVKATSLQEKANASLRERNSAYRIGEITIGASFPPSIQFAIQRVDDPDQLLHDSSILLAKAIEEREGDAGKGPATIVGLDGTTVDVEDLDALDELGDEDER